MFQSTRPAGGATCCENLGSVTIAVSIHAPRGGRDVGNRPGHADVAVSIHAPRGGRDRQAITA
jgi:hypothetical protein